MISVPIPQLSSDTQSVFTLLARLQIYSSMLSLRKDWNYFSPLNQSGDAVAPWAFTGTDEARTRALALGKLLGCEGKTSEDLLECLQKVEDFNIIVENQQKVGAAILWKGGGG